MKSTVAKQIDYTNLEMIRDLWRFLTPYRRRFCLGVGLRLVGRILWVIPPYLSGLIITFLSSYEVGTDAWYAWRLLLLMMLLALTHHITTELSRSTVYPIAEQVDIDARNRTVAHLLDINMSWHERELSGNTMEKITNGGRGMGTIIRSFLNFFIVSLVDLVGITIVFITLDMRLIAALLVFFFTYYLISYILAQPAVRQAYVVNKEWERYTGVAFESINNIAVIKSLGIGSSIVRFLRDISQTLSQEITRRITLFRLRSASLLLYQELFRIALLAITIWQVIMGELPVGIIALVLLYFSRVRDAASEFAETYNEFLSTKVAMYRMKEILREEPTIERSGKYRFDSAWKMITIKDLYFSYEREDVLQGISLSVSRGEKVGIVGISGAGKSTLFKLLLKLYDGYEGEIRFDDRSLHDITRSTYLPHVAVVPQETELFDLSLRDNITLSHRRFDRTAFDRAIEIAHVADFADRLPKSVDSRIGEKGVKLSGGERQRVGIARAVYKLPDLLLLDEATSHLDAQSERKIQDSLHRFFEGVTAIVIAHRLSTIKEMDRIIVMGEGRILEEGPFDALMAQKGVFYDMWQKQQF